MLIDNMRIVEADLIVRVPPDRAGQLAQREALTGVRSMFDRKRSRLRGRRRFLSRGRSDPKEFKGAK